jgi:hypothetical protein
MIRNSQPWSLLFCLADLLLFLSFIISLAIGGWALMVISAILSGDAKTAIAILSLLVPPTTVAPSSLISEIATVMGLMGFASFFGFGMACSLDPSYTFINASVRRDYAWMAIAIFLGLFMLLPPLLFIVHWLPAYLSDTILFVYCALQSAYAIGFAYAIKLLKEASQARGDQM